MGACQRRNRVLANGSFTSSGLQAAGGWRPARVDRLCKVRAGFMQSRQGTSSWKGQGEIPALVGEVRERGGVAGQA